MKSILSVVKLLLTNMYRPSPGERKGGKIAVWILIAVIYLFFEFAIVTTMIEIAPMFKEAGLIPEFLTGVMVFGLMAVTALGIMPMLTLLYFSKDSEFFLSLPLLPSKVYFAKLITVYLSQLAMTTAILLPALYAVGIAVGLNWAFFIVMIFALLLLPAFPLLIISIICLPLMYLMRFFKNRGAVASVVTMVLFVAIFFSYMLVMRTDGPVDDAQMFEAMSGTVNRIADIFVPITAINKFATFTKMEGYSEAISLLLNFFIFTVPALLLFVLTLIISRRAYSNALMSSLENTGSTARGSIYQNKRGVVKALMIKEWKEIIRTPIFALQCFMGLIIAPITIIIIGAEVSSIEVSPQGAETAAYTTWLIITVFIQFIVVSLNIGASTTFSRDGGAFYISKLLPIPYETQIKAKTMLFTLIYSIDLTLCVVIQFILFGFEGWWVELLLWVYLLIFNYGFTMMCMLMDLSKPKLDWKSYREIVRNSRNATLPTLIGIGASVVIGGIALALMMVMFAFMSAQLAAGLITALMLGLAIAFAVIMRSVLYSNAKKFYERIDG